jgi:transcriptional regulator with XRE-family HTH domain
MSMVRSPRFRSKGLQALYDRYVGDDPQKADAYEVAKTNAEVAQALYDLRTGAGLTQRKLANLVGTTPSVICRLEDADYEGHSLSMLRRIGKVLGMRVETKFVPETKALADAGTSSAPRPEKGTTRIKMRRATPTPQLRYAAKRAASAKGAVGKSAPLESVPAKPAPKPAPKKTPTKAAPKKKVRQ